ncbi:tetratricopeptide repeat protein (plasmid) [Photobacterium sp. DA100]|uniref:tetratricopeptide repeat protein n=1 Tax=Photobacterium sp. DA100 TaxID=3027472 RepID=UPI00247A741D|nr:tetratricopeptide repeat protein [Photobacterium sp. DA100]WEM45696.1 tetratricopeptide repeat protein [Photobacterium sp. DA100]
MIKKLTLLVALSLPLGLMPQLAVCAELSQYTAGRVQRAHALQQDEKLTEAIALLEGINPSRAYDKAYVQRMLGVFYWQQNNKTKAIANLTDAVNSGLLQDEQAWITQRMLADILLTSEEFKQALPHYYALSNNVPENQKADELWLRIAQSHYQISEWQQSLTAINAYAKLAGKLDVQPLTIKLGAQLQLKQWKAALLTLESLIALEPNKLVWWQQTAGIQLRLGHSKSALETLALARRQGVDLSQQDLKTLAQLYAQRGIPERAAIVYSQLDGADSDVDLLVLQAQYWQIAKEWDKSISVWHRAAALNNKHRWSLAQLLLQQGDYQQAIAELDKVSDKAREADVALAKVRAYYKLDNLEKAIIFAKQADNIESTTASKSWIKYLSQKREMAS